MHWRRTGALLLAAAICFAGCTALMPERPAPAPGGPGEAPSVAAPPEPQQPPDTPAPAAPPAHRDPPAAPQERPGPGSAPDGDPGPPPAPGPRDGYSPPPPIAHIRSFYTRDYAGYTYVGSPFYSSAGIEFDPESARGRHEQAIKDTLALFGGLAPSPEQVSITDNEFLFWTEDGERHVYGTGRGGYAVLDGDTYLLPQESNLPVQSFHDQMIAQVGETTDAYPMWLIWMTPSKIRTVVYHSPGGEKVIAPGLTQHAAQQAVCRV